MPGASEELVEKGPEERVVELESERLMVESELLREGVSKGVDGARLRFEGLLLDVCEGGSVAMKEGEGERDGPGEGEGEMRKLEREEFGWRRGWLPGLMLGLVACSIS